MSKTEIVTDYEIYEKVLLGEVPRAERFLWIGTSDLKDLHVDKNGRRVPFLEILSGLVEKPVMLSWGQFKSFPQVEDVSDFHCVTTWSRLDNHWVGVRFSDIANHCQIKPEAKFVYIKAYDGYSTNLPLEEAMKYDVLLVHQWEGKALDKEHGGPVRMITPQLYAWKGAKWIGEIVFREEDELGFWEQRGYSNTADPWLEERYSR